VRPAGVYLSREVTTAARPGSHLAPACVCLAGRRTHPSAPRWTRPALCSPRAARAANRPPCAAARTGAGTSPTGAGGMGRGPHRPQRWRLRAAAPGPLPVLDPLTHAGRQEKVRGTDEARAPAWPEV